MSSHLIARLGDKSSHGGTIITASSMHTVDGKPIARIGDLHACPIRGHGITPIVSSPASAHLVEGKGMAVVGATTGCGATIVTGAPSGSSAQNP